MGSHAYTYLCDYPAHHLLEMLRGGDVTAEQIMKSVFDRIRAVEGELPKLDNYPQLSELASADEATRTRIREEIRASKVHSYISLREDEAMEEARQVDRKLKAGEKVGPLAGIPLGIKDIFCVKGTPSTAASKILASFVAPYDATPVERLRRAGAIVVGKTNLDEFTFGSSNESSAFQPSPTNPWDTRCSPGGSSGGSAAAVAAGEAIFTLGTDTSGSIRQPAAFCGVVGLKPTYGRVSRYGLIAFGSSLDTVGPLTRDVHDAALTLNVMAGYDPHDATTATEPVPDFTQELGKSIKGMKIGWPRQYFVVEYPEPGTGKIGEREIQPEVSERMLEVRTVLEDAGAQIVEIDQPYTRFGIPAYFVISRMEAMSNLHRFDGVKYGYRSDAPEARETVRELYAHTRGYGFGDQPQTRILMGMYVMSTLYRAGYNKKAMRIRRMIREDLEQAFKQVECIVAPTSPFTAFPLQRSITYLEEFEDMEPIDTVLMQYADCLTVVANHSGIPAISLPCGFDEKGLPVGVQFMAHHWDEATMFRAAYAYEQATDWHTQRPPLVNGA